MKMDDVAVIGAGIGGLAAALRLAAAGLSVTIYEAAPEPGGKMRATASAAGPVECGPTVLTMKPVFESLFAAAGLDLADHVTLHRQSVLARHFWADGSRLDLLADRDATAAEIAAFAGTRAARDYGAFADRMARLFAAFDQPVVRTARPSLPAIMARVLRQPALIGAMAPGASMARDIARSFTDPRLQQLFGRYATYVGGSPGRSPALLSLISHSEAAGVWVIEEGMHGLATAIADAAGALGATLAYGSPVTGLRRDGDGWRIALPGGTARARRVIFNGDPKALADGRLGPGVQSAIGPAAVAPRSHSAHVWAFAAQPEGVALAHHNVFFGDVPNDEFPPLDRGAVPQDATLYVCAQDRGRPAPPNGPERFEIIRNAPPLGAAPTDPDTEARTCWTRTFPRLAGMGLRFAPPPQTDALTTPAMFDRLFPGSDGSLYGRSPHGMTATFRRPTARSRIADLYLAGGGVHPGAGVPMACLSGGHAAAAILRDLASTSPSRRTATRGGMSTASATTVAARSRSSPS